MQNEIISQSKSQIPLPKCPKGSQAIQACINQKCTMKSFTCNNQLCECRNSHQCCQQISIKALEKLINQNSFPTNKLQQEIQKVFNNAIDNLSSKRQKFLQRIKQDFQYLGLNEMQQKFLNVTQNGADDSQITCDFLWNLHLQLKRQTKIQFKSQTFEKQMAQIGKGFDKEIKELNRRLTNVLKQINQKTSDIFLTSKIIKKFQQTNILLAFFKGKKVDSVRLFYRASQNDFLAQKFHQKCHNIPNTLTLVETEFGKIIGGFTSYTWTISEQKPDTHWNSANGNVKDHFIFSLTNNEKFTLTPPGNHCMLVSDVLSRKQTGPVFGMGFDLRIYDKANEDRYSSANPGTTYKNPNYKSNDEHSHQKFAGGKMFKIKQWEVWEVRFKQ